MWPVFCSLRHCLELSAMTWFSRDTNEAFRGLKAGPPAGVRTQLFASLQGFVARTHYLVEACTLAEADQTVTVSGMAPIVAVSLAVGTLLVASRMMAITAMVLDAEIPGSNMSCTMTPASISAADRTLDHSGGGLLSLDDKSVLIAAPAATFGDTRRQKLGVQISNCCGVFRVERLLARRDHSAEPIYPGRVMAIRCRPISSGTHFPTVMRPGSSREKGSGTTTKNDTTRNWLFCGPLSLRLLACTMGHLQGFTPADCQALDCDPFATFASHPKASRPASNHERTCLSHVVSPGSLETEGLLNSMHSAQACDTMPHERGSFHRPPFWRSYPHFPHTSPRGIS